MKQTQIIMGMPITIEIVDSGFVYEEIIQIAFDEFRRIDMIFSTYKPASEISRLNNGELTLQTVSNEVREVLAVCDQLKSKTRGYFDIKHNNTIDPSGYVKGWAIGKVESILRHEGIKNFVISAGGDMVCAGNKAEYEPWLIGISDPLEPGKTIKNLALSNRAIATSALYERGEHIYNPITGKSATELTSVSVIGPDIVTADVYATTIFSMGRSGISWIQGQSDYAAYILTSNYEAVYTPSLVEYLVN